MKIIVCVKQVPNVTEVKWDPETGSLIRKGVPSIINPDDRHAIEAGLQMKEKYGGTVTVMSMGPSQVEEALREALAMGVDEAVQLTDKVFAGSDTWATSQTLGLAIRKIGDYDVVLCGKEAMDGMTAQVGPQIAEYLGIVQLTYAVEAEMHEGKIRVKQALGNLHRLLEAELPVLITVERAMNEPRVAPMDSVIDAYSKEIALWKANDLEGDGDEFGLSGSPTRLRKVFTPKRIKSDVEILDGSTEDIARQFVEKLIELHII